MLQPIISERIELTIQPGANLEPVKVDPGQMEQVLLNLVVNAKDSMADGGQLTVRTANVYVDPSQSYRSGNTIPGPYVMISVTDSGTGISEETKRHIFEPFFTTKEVGEGSGLGLSTCYGIITQAGGFMEVGSELGTGTTFKVYLPVTDEPSEPPSQIDNTDSLSKGNETILLAEDEPMVRSMLSVVLREQGYRVLPAADGAEAIRLFQENTDQVDLLVTDVVMPNLTGPELADRLRSDRPELSVLFTSGYTREITFQNGKLAPGMEFLQKPYLPPVLAGKVREVLNTSYSGRE